MKYRLACATALILTLAALPAAAQTYQVIDTQTTQVSGNLARTDVTVQVGSDPLNQFGMHRLAKAHGAEPKGILLLLPPLGNTFRFFELDEHGVYERSFAAFFALKGWEVWGYSPRGSELVAGQCESGAVDCSAMADWGLQAVVDDVAFIRSRIEAAHPGVDPYVGGFSLGGMTTIATIDAHPGDYAGALILEGALYTEDPAIRAINQGYCDATEAALAAGQIYDGQSLPFIKLIAQLAATAPDAPSPLPPFAGLTNHQALIVLLGVYTPGPLSPSPGFVRCAGSVAEDRFFYCTDERTITHSLEFHDYVDNLTLRDISCSLAGERTFTDNLGAFTAPVYFLGGGLGFAPYDLDLANVLGSTDVTFNHIAEFGHADHWFSAEHRSFLEADILRWLNRQR